jgi:membrane protein required for colicin V production
MWHVGVVDAIILVILTLSILTGLFRGFLKELVALFVWITAIWLGIKYADYAGSFLISYIHDEIARHAAGFVIILLPIIISGSIINALLSFILKNTGLSGTDRLLGIIFGFVRGVFIVALIILAVRVTNLLPVEEYVNKSILYSKFTPVVNWLYKLSPDFVKDVNKSSPPEPVRENI